MGNALTSADICDLHAWAQVIAPDLYFESTGPGEGRILVPSQDALTTSHVLQRHIRYHARLERAK